MPQDRRGPPDPGVPPHLRSAIPARKESEVLKAVLAWLNQQPGVVAWRANSGAMFGEHKGKSWAVRFGFPGLADVIGWRKTHAWGGDLIPTGHIVAQFISLEIKAPGWTPPKLGPALIHWQRQQAFLDKVNAAGGIGAVVRSVEEAEEALRR